MPHNYCRFLVLFAQLLRLFRCYAQLKRLFGTFVPILCHFCLKICDVMVKNKNCQKNRVNLLWCSGSIIGLQKVQKLLYPSSSLDQVDFFLLFIWFLRQHVCFLNEFDSVLGRLSLRCDIQLYILCYCCCVVKKRHTKGYFVRGILFLIFSQKVWFLCTRTRIYARVRTCAKKCTTFEDFC